MKTHLEIKDRNPHTNRANTRGDGLATTEKWQVDECLDANGYFTVRPYKYGSDNGDTDAQPIATVYDEVSACLIEAAPELLAFARYIATHNFGTTIESCASRLVAQAEAAQ